MKKKILAIALILAITPTFLLVAATTSASSEDGAKAILDGNHLAFNIPSQIPSQIRNPMRSAVEAIGGNTAGTDPAPANGEVTIAAGSSATFINNHAKTAVVIELLKGRIDYVIYRADGTERSRTSNRGAGFTMGAGTRVVVSPSGGQGAVVMQIPLNRVQDVSVRLN